MRATHQESGTKNGAGVGDGSSEYQTGWRESYPSTGSDRLIELKRYRPISVLGRRKTNQNAQSPKKTNHEAS
jgi:hypothetical protein